MEVVWSIVGCYRVIFAIESKFTICDSVGVSPGDAAEVGAFLDIFRDLIET